MRQNPLGNSPSAHRRPSVSPFSVVSLLATIQRQPYSANPANGPLRGQHVRWLVLRECVCRRVIHCGRNPHRSSRASNRALVFHARAFSPWPDAHAFRGATPPRSPGIIAGRWNAFQGHSVASDGVSFESSPESEVLPTLVDPPFSVKLIHLAIVCRGHPTASAISCWVAAIPSHTFSHLFTPFHPNCVKTVYYLHFCVHGLESV